ncbi:uncharacterized protein G2W53_036605 [Senna tora]|uniref:Uncharacterized protein n=1 Tax=Senna tora TaxID=362788 RepID=A0A834SUB1_9FABA|nr:uncharacterized protein G2W53_036605 [Senna tora]
MAQPARTTQIKKERNQSSDHCLPPKTPPNYEIN